MLLLDGLALLMGAAVMLWGRYCLSAVSYTRRLGQARLQHGIHDRVARHEVVTINAVLPLLGGGLSGNSANIGRFRWIPLRQAPGEHQDRCVEDREDQGRHAEDAPGV